MGIVFCSRHQSLKPFFAKKKEIMNRKEPSPLKEINPKPPASPSPTPPPKARNRQSTNNSFEWSIIDFDFMGHEYTIKNRVTGEVRTIAKELYLELLKEQGDKK